MPGALSTEYDVPARSAHKTRSAARVQEEVVADSYMLIIGHVGAPKQETHITSCSNPAEAVRQYNNALRGARPGIVCVCVYVPGWRRLAVDALVLLWHRSRKLHCRMRFGIALAHELSLPCFVSPIAMQGDEARKTMPHIVGRLEDQTDAAQALVALNESADGASTTAAAKRLRRPSAHDAALAESVIFGDLATDSITATIQNTPSFVTARVRPRELEYDDDALDRLNTLTYQQEPICFTVGKHGHISKRTSALKRQHRHASRSIDTVRRLTHNYDDDDDNNSEEAENDEDSSNSTAVAITAAQPPARKVKRKKTDDESGAVDLEPIRQRNTVEIDLYKTSSNKAASPSTSALAVRASDAAARNCLVDGVFDNRRLLERAEECYTDANEYLDRPMANVRIDRVQLCVCGARDSFAQDRICNVCRRTSRSTRILRTNLVALREQATHRKCAPDERRELRHLALGAERHTSIDEYSRATTQQLREVLAQQTPATPPPPTSLPTAAPKEMTFISAALLHVRTRK